MRLELSDGRILQSITQNQLRDELQALRDAGPYFAVLVADSGDYLQAAGNRPWCVIERRQLTPLTHSRAYQATTNPKYRDGAKLATGAGSITLLHDEWFLQKDCMEIFQAFLAGQPFPPALQWRSMNGVLGI